jgi:arylsulfatase A-like enzyme
MLKIISSATLGAFAASGIISPDCCAGQNAGKPNIILIMADDMGWGDSELNGNRIIDTPNLNELANNGIEFTNFYVSPMCAPTRASLMTGRHNLRTGTSWVCGRTEYLALGETTLADVLMSNGYATALYGKWHLGEYGPYHPNERGFRNFLGILQGSIPNYYQSNLDYNRKSLITEEYITTVLTDSAIGFMEKNLYQPFFCFLSYNVPHHPYQAPEEYFQKYKKRGVTDDKTASVYGMIEHMDSNIGRLLSRLEQLDLSRNTVVIFMSDNGPAFQRHNDGLKGIKTEVSEGSVKTVFYISWKGQFQKNMKIPEISAHIDIMPTLLDIVNCKKPDSVVFDGISLLPLIKGKSIKNRDRMIYTHQNVVRNCSMHPGSLRTQNYLLEHWKNGYQLFDMINDPGQKRNIAERDTGTTNQLIRKYENWYLEVTSENQPYPPIPIGYKNYDSVTVIAPDAVLKGGVKYTGNWGCHPDWIINWTSTGDSILWPVEVYRKGTYEFLIEYNCPKENIGSGIKLSSDDGEIEAVLEKPFFSALIELPNNTGKFSPGVKEWALLKLGTLQLSEGKQTLALTAYDIKGKEVAEIKSLKVIRLP